MADIDTTSKGRGGMRLAKNSGWQLVSFAARAAGGLAVIFILARAAGPRGVGIYQFGITIGTLIPFYWGFPVLIAREVARRPEDARKWAECGAVVTLLIGGLSTLMVAAGGRLFGMGPIMLDAVVLACAGLVIDSVARIWFSVFWAWERMGLEAIATWAQELALVAGSAAVAVAGGSVKEMLGVFIASRIVGAGMAWLIISRRLGHPVLPRTSPAFAWTALKMATPFAANNTLTLVYARIDTIMMGAKGPTAVGLYQAAKNLVQNFNILARSVGHAIYPRMARAWQNARERVGVLRDTSLTSLALIAVPVTIGSLLLAPEILRFLYGSQFDRAILTYRILVIAIPVRMLGNTLSLTLSATNREKSRTVAVAIAAAGNVLLNLFFIPRWSYVGAAIAALITEAGLFIAYDLMVRTVAGPSRLFRAVAIPALACVPMIVVVMAMASAPMPVPVAGGVLAYGVGLLAIAALRTRSGRRDPKALMTAIVGTGS
jgi:O-antigen/teichoic acid export membrane protein